jgi:predicted nucleotidyltransferase component of viral defense system
VFQLERKPVLTTYDEFSDLPSGKLLQVYSFQEIIVEKTLAITDGARKEPRDLYDLWYISDAGHMPACEVMVDGLNRKLASREGRADDILVPRLEKVEQTLTLVWDRRLRSQVMNLPDFARCFRVVKRLLSDFDQLRKRHLSR